MSDLIFLLLGLVNAFGLAVCHHCHKNLSRRHELLAKKVRGNPPEQPPSKSKWHAMPCGTRLELGATGYWIELVGKKGKHPFRAWDPEGDCIGEGNSLPGIKKALERQAAYRAEFKASRPRRLRLNDER